MKVFTEDQVQTFLKSIHGQVDEALFYLAVTTGMRQSELIALKWSDLSVTNKTIIIERQLKRHYVGSDFFTQPKTKNGIRIIQVGRKAIELLNKHKEKQEIHKALFDSEWQEFDLIFPSFTGLPIRQFSIYKRFIHIVDQAKLPRIRFHDLRHTAASIMLNHNIPMIVVSRRLGHYKVSFTIDTYGHLMPEMQEKAAELMDSFLD
jgi:integrase